MSARTVAVVLLGLCLSCDSDPKPDVTLAPLKKSPEVRAVEALAAVESLVYTGNHGAPLGPVQHPSILSRIAEGNLVALNGFRPRLARANEDLAAALEEVSDMVALDEASRSASGLAFADRADGLRARASQALEQIAGNALGPILQVTVEVIDDAAASFACPANCHGHGLCHFGRCFCEPGWSGPACGVSACPNACSDNGLCLNGVCFCEPGWSGDDCSVSACPNACSDNGLCQNGHCFCEPGWTGEDCGTHVGCPNACSGNGVCINGACACEAGWTGEDCRVHASCANDCSGNGVCLNGACVCEAGWSGSDCGTAACPNACSGNGVCENGHCFCEAGWSGSDCGTHAGCLNDCSAHGVCFNGVCACEAPWFGPDCSSFPR